MLEVLTRHVGLSAMVLLILLPLVLFRSAWAEPAPAFEGLEVLERPVPGPNVALLDETGSSVALKGAPVTVLNFWATWCAPCVAELPTLLALDEALGDQGLRVVAASLDRTYGQINSFWTAQGWGDSVEVALDAKGSLFRAFSSQDLGARGVPYTAVLNAQGEVVSWYAGEADWASAPVKAYFEGLLNGALEQSE
ncbi:TlpA family protein disulfide reductase [bacterium]|nr:TlpA family protein disulfide reductase [bacterium]